MLALLMGVTGTTFRPDKAAARPTDVIAFNPDVCAAITHSGDAFCYSLNDSADLAALADALYGAVDDPATYQDLVDASAAQLGDDSQILVPGSQSLWVLSFVSNDDLLTLTADEGVWLSTANPGPAKSTTTACPIDADTALADADCDANAATDGDGVVVDLLYSGVPAADTDPADFLDPGPATLTATQSGIDMDMDYTVVGAPPGDITVNADPASMACDGLTSSVVTASLTDGDGNPVADGTPVHFSVQGRAIIDPVNALTIGGTASTALIGLSGVTVTLSVSATSGNLEDSVDVECVAPPPPLPGDVNCTGTVTMVDAMLIAQKVAGLIDGFPCSTLPTTTPGT
jgi:hypothetical protein